MDDIRDRPLNRPCLKCGAMLTKTIRWYRENKGVPCESCGTPIYVVQDGDIIMPGIEDVGQPQ